MIVDTSFKARHYIVLGKWFRDRGSIIIPEPTRRYMVKESAGSALLYTKTLPGDLDVQYGDKVAKMVSN